MKYPTVFVSVSTYRICGTKGLHSIETINRIIALLFAICYFYQYIYVLVPYFKKYRIVPKNSGNAGKATIADADLNRKQNRFAAVR